MQCIGGATSPGEVSPYSVVLSETDQFRDGRSAILGTKPYSLLPETCRSPKFRPHLKLSYCPLERVIARLTWCRPYLQSDYPPASFCSEKVVLPHVSKPRGRNPYCEADKQEITQLDTNGDIQCYERPLSKGIWHTYRN